MKIKNILIVPTTMLAPSTEFFLKRLARVVKYGIGSLFPLPYHGELQMHGDIPRVLGKEHTFIIGKYHQSLFSKDISEQCAYPSCYGIPEGTSIGKRDINVVIGRVDVVLVSAQAARELIELVVKQARAKKIPIAMIDFADHEALYGLNDQEKRKRMFRGFIPGNHFDLYFKKDLYLGYKTDTLLPLAPVPVRPESYNIPVIKKDTSIFFSGRLRADLCQADRMETTDLVRKNFSDALIVDFESQKSFMTTKEYWHNLSRSHLALSPSGRVWDSFRHCEVGLAAGTCLIAPKPYVETVGPYLVDGHNAILYDTQLSNDGKHHIVNQGELVEKIRYYLDHQEEREAMAKRWQSDVLQGHTIFSRSKYIVESMEKAFS